MQAPEMTRSHARRSQRSIDRLALEREEGEDAFVDTVERLAAGEPLQRLDAERELAPN
jgi:hypothetical protein